ncbi:hypothetical protein [Streptomyces sp. NPDC052042]|uniref:hypothetical protein n=1 Tax=Streptomyces sp. NPDC052042 TaxID=3365683 RepID=UPI0037D792E0
MQEGLEPDRRLDIPDLDAPVRLGFGAARPWLASGSELGPYDQQFLDEEQAAANCVTTCVDGQVLRVKWARRQSRY